MPVQIGVSFADWQQWAVPAAIFVSVLLIGLVVRGWVFRWIGTWTQRTATSADDILVEAIRQPFMVWMLILALHLASQASTLPPRYTALLSKVLLVLWTISFTLVLARMSSAMIRHYGTRVHSGFQVTSLTENIARIGVLVLGALLVLNALGVSITPMLTALGVGGLAVALALQDTLSNFFAGFYLMMAGQIRVGDYIKLNSGEEGFVADISWRSLTIRTLPNNYVLVPNAKVAQANVTNYSLPETRMSLLIPIGVSYESDPDHVERVLLEEATAAAGQIPGLLAEPGPMVRFIPGFGDSSLDFTLILQVAQFVDQYLVQHEMRKRILRRFRREGITIPFPMRTVHLITADADKTSGKEPAGRAPVSAGRDGGSDRSRSH